MTPQCGGGTASMLSPVVSRHLRTCYRDSIRKASVPGGRCRPAVRFFPDAAAGEGAYCWSSSASSASSPGWDASARCSPASVSFSSDGGDLWFSGCLDGAEELRAVALRMVHDGYMKGLIRAFGAAGSSSAAHCGGLVPGPEELLLGSWFSELDVEWVLHARQGDKLRPLLEDGCASLLDLMESWIKALKTMAQVLCITQLELRAKWPAVAGGVRKAVRYFLLLATGKAAEREQVQEAAQLARFAEASVRRMLDFVDAVADAALNDDDDDQAAAEMLPGMLRVYACVVDDSPAVLALFKEAPGPAAASTFDAMNGVFLRKRRKLSDAVWSMVEKVRASFMADDSWRVSPDEAGGVHETTRLVMNCAMLLWRNEGALNLVLQDQQHRFRMFLSDPEHDGHCSSSVAELIKNMISSSEKQLEKASNFISDPGLRYIFLMNNCSFISEKVSSLLLPPFEDRKIERSRGCRERLPPMEDWVSQPDQRIRAKIEMDSNLDGLIKIRSFMEAYLEASWEPVMACLYHDIPRGFLNCGAALDKFESEFRRTYAMQRMWKVPNPELRKRLREAVVEKVISGYNQYVAERMARGKKSNRPHASTPLELEELLEELFEG